jgi:hypothetical protein
LRAFYTHPSAAAPTVLLDLAKHFDRFSFSAGKRTSPGTTPLAAHYNIEPTSSLSREDLTNVPFDTATSLPSMGMWSLELTPPLGAVTYTASYGDYACAAVHFTKKVSGPLELTACSAASLPDTITDTDIVAAGRGPCESPTSITTQLPGSLVQTVNDATTATATATASLPPHGSKHSNDNGMVFWLLEIMYMFLVVFIR